MSTITDVIDCPQCGLPAQEDTYYVIDEEYVHCDYCGYSHRRVGDKLESSKGYGTMHYVSETENKNGSNIREKIVKLSGTVDLVQRSQLITELSKYSGKSALYVWNEEANKLETLYGFKPQTLEERIIEEQNKHNYYDSLKNNNFNQSELVDFNDL